MSIRPPAAVAAAQSVAVLADSTLGVAAATITLSAIPQTYKHLRLMFSGANSGAGAVAELRMRFNNDSVSTYNSQGSKIYSAASVFDNGATYAVLGYITAAASAPRQSIAVLDVADYAGTTLNKVGLTIVGGRADAVAWSSSTHNFPSSVGITRIDLFCDADNFIAGTRVTLLGVG